MPAQSGLYPREEAIDESEIHYKKKEKKSLKSWFKIPSLLRKQHIN